MRKAACGLEEGCHGAPARSWEANVLPVHSQVVFAEVTVSWVCGIMAVEQDHGTRATHERACEDLQPKLLAF